MITLGALQEEFEDYCRRHPLGKEPESLYDATTYMMSLGGKRMRPMLLLLAYGMWSERHEIAMPAALAVEVFHNFTLAHDDIMDAAEMRRGKTSLHVHTDANTAILAGDVMLIKSYDLLLDACSPEQGHALLGLLTETALQICEGQQMDMDFEERLDVTLNEYMQMNTFKTAVLLGLSLQIGALLGGASDEDARSLRQAGILLGRAFQIQDDLLDAYGDEGMTGKKRGGDIVNAKKTYLYSACLERLQPNVRQRFAELYSEQFDNPEVKIQKVIAYFDQAAVAPVAENHLRELYQEGTDIIERIQANPGGKIRLDEYVTLLMKRQA